MFPFIFLLPEQKKNETKRKFAVCIFLPTPALFSAEQKELATLKQLFVLNAPKSTYASRQKKRPEAAGVDVFRFVRSGI